MKETLEFLGVIIVVMVALTVGIMLALLPVAWFDGHAKAAWIKQTRGVELPWYQATFLEIKVGDDNVNLDLK